MNKLIALALLCIASVTSAAPNWTTVVKPSDQAKVNDATLANDTALAVSLQASRKYAVRAVVFYLVPSTGGGCIQYALSAPSGWSVKGEDYMDNVTSYPPFITAHDARTYCPIDTGNTNVGVIRIDATVTTNSAGTLAFEWAQGSSNAGATTVLAGSWLEVKDP